MPDAGQTGALMEFAKFIGIGGAAVLCVVVWWLAMRLRERDADYKAEVAFSKERERESFHVLANLTKVYEQGVNASTTHNLEVRNDLHELKLSVDSLREMMIRHSAGLPPNPPIKGIGVL